MEPKTTPNKSKSKIMQTEKGMKAEELLRERNGRKEIQGRRGAGVKAERQCCGPGVEGEAARQ